jgi:hypothetical protein
VAEAQDKAAVKRMQAALGEVREARERLSATNARHLTSLSLKPLLFTVEELRESRPLALGFLPLPHDLAASLNIASVFLAAVSYYIVVPTTNTYAEALGLDASYSGVIIGMSPLAQVMASFWYAKISNRSFRLPLLVSALLQLLGAWSGHDMAA